MAARPDAPVEIGKAFRQGVAFINGQRVPGVCYGAIPLRADVTGLLKLDGENELTVMTLGEICLSREDYVDRYNPDAWIENDGHRDYPPTDDNIGAGLAGVWLRRCPEVRVRQTLVIPDVDKGQVIVFNRVENRSKDPCTVELRYAMSQQGKEVPQATVPSQSVTLKPGEIVEVKSVGNGQGLRPYTPASPVLTKLATTVTEKGLFSKKVLDVEEIALRLSHGEGQGRRAHAQRPAGGTPGHGANGQRSRNLRSRKRHHDLAMPAVLVGRNGRGWPPVLSVHHQLLAGGGVGTAQ